MELSSPVQVRASLLSLKVFDLTRDREAKGRIHSRFQNALNMEFEEGLLFNLLPENISPNPRSVILPLNEWNRIQPLSFHSGLLVLANSDTLEIPYLSLEVCLKKAEVWDSAPSLSGPPVSDMQIRRNLEMLKRVIYQNGRKGNAGDKPEGAYKEFQDRIRRHLSSLYLCISSRDFERITETSFQLIGLGLGLTPSGDDILSGVMAAGVFFSLACDAFYPDAQEINNRICSAVHKTTVFGQTLLYDASKGEVVRPLGQLLQNILCRTDTRSIILFARQVMSLGESSGREMLTGIHLGLEAFLRLKDEITGSLGREGWQTQAIGANR